MRFFQNPKPKKSKRAKKSKRTSVKRGAKGRFVAKRRRTVRRASTATRKRRVTRKVGGIPMAKRRRSTARKTTAARRRRRRSTGSIKLSRIKGAVYRRNPGIVGTLTRGVKDAAVAVAGKTAARFIGSKLPAIVPGQTGQVVNAAISAAAIGMIAQKFLGADMARLMVQGAMQAPVESLLSPALASIGLSSYSRGRLSAYSVPMLAGYNGVPSPALASYPSAQPSTMMAAY